MPFETTLPADGEIDILFVGDENEVVEVTPYIERESDGITVHAAKGADDGRELLSTGEMNCVVAGAELPVTTVTEFLQTVRDERPHIPVILFAGNDDGVVSEAFSAGITDYVPRAGVADPPAVLADRIERVVRSAARRRAENSRYELFAKAQEIADVGAWEYDAQTDDLWWSEQVRRMHGLSDDEQPTLAESFDLYDPEDRQTIEASFDQAITAGIPYDVELRLDAADDEERWIRARGQPEFKDDTIVRVRGSYQDFTDLKRRELQFESLHDASRELMEAKTRMDVAQITADASKNILGYVMTTIRLADEDGEMLQTFTATDQSVTQAGKRPNYRIDGNTPAARTYRRGEPEIFDDLNRTADDYDRGALRSGIYVPIGDHGVLSTGDTEPYAFDEPDVEILGVLTKLAAGALTRIRSEQELQRQNERLEEFAGIVAHDLRNPLNIARGELTLLESAATERVERIDASLDRMETLIEEVLTLARQGRVVGETTTVTLSAVARQAWESVEMGAATLTVDEADVDLVADEFRLRELFENLFRNAVEHASDDVTVSVGPCSDGERSGGPRSSVEQGSTGGFFVEDDGPGIPDHEKENVFEAGHTTTIDGTGYGLYIVSEIAAAHEWEIEVADACGVSDEGSESEARQTQSGGGTRFEVTGVETE
jgi:signal transduction histidine kinase/PAS domain-containing protein